MRCLNKVVLIHPLSYDAWTYINEILGNRFWKFSQTSWYICLLTNMWMKDFMNVHSDHPIYFQFKEIGSKFLIYLGLSIPMALIV